MLKEGLIEQRLSEDVRTIRKKTRYSPNGELQARMGQGQEHMVALIKEMEAVVDLIKPKGPVAWTDCREKRGACNVVARVVKD
jgi:hypothetical protein